MKLKLKSSFKTFKEKLILFALTVTKKKLVTTKNIEL